VIAAALLAAGAVALAPGPNLRVASVGTQARAGSPGELILPTRIRNAGNRRAGASHTRYVLSRDRMRGGDVRLSSVPVAAMRAGRSRTITAMLHLPAGLKRGSWYVIACADGRHAVAERSERDNCRASGEPIAVLPEILPELPPPPDEEAG